jgi:hypothetical protein
MLLNIATLTRCDVVLSISWQLRQEYGFYTWLVAHHRRTQDSSFNTTTVSLTTSHLFTNHQRLLKVRLHLLKYLSQYANSLNSQMWKSFCAPSEAEPLRYTHPSAGPGLQPVESAAPAGHEMAGTSRTTVQSRSQSTCKPAYHATTSMEIGMTS